MKHPERYLITAALPYANGPLHIGHIAGVYLNADIYVKFLKLMAKDVVFICGSDENGAAITMRAKKEGKNPQEIIDTYHQLFQSSFDGLGIDFDYYDRTSSKEHHQTAQDFFRTLAKKDVFETQESEQYYDEESQQFLADRYIQGTCPKCGFEEAYGDQCENCGSTLSPLELIDPVSTLSGSKPSLKKTRHWYLPLQKDETWLKTWLEEGTIDGKWVHDPAQWKTHVKGQCKSWIDGGLQPRAMTRDLDWGVDVPQELEGSEGKKLYVWMDAPIGYITATQKWAAENKKDWKDYWQSEDTSLIHFLGKDNIVFHCIIFPTLLKAHGDYILPDNVPANQFMNLEGRKISTSKNWAVWVHEYLEDFEGKADILRYVLTKIMPENKDSEFTWEAFQTYNNNELVNTLGNFINRVLVLTHKYYDGKVPDFDPDLDFNSGLEQDHPTYHDSELLDLFDLTQEYCQYIRDFEFKQALQALIKIAERGNQLLQFNEPWKLVKEDEETVKVIMNAAIQYVGMLSITMQPILPFSSNTLRAWLNLPKIEGKGELLDCLNALAEGTPIVPSGQEIQKPSLLFEKIDDQTVEKQREKLKENSNTSVEKNSVPIKDSIEFDDFQKLDLRSATILHAEKVPKTKKLLKISLDLGLEKRTVVSGIAEHYDPEEITGQQVVLVANLKPRKIRGVESKGMILMAEDTDGSLKFVQPKDKINAGSTVS